MLFIKVKDEIKSGDNYTSIFSLDKFSERLADSGIKLSKLYRDVLISEKLLGFVPEVKCKLYEEEKMNFYDKICAYVFSPKQTVKILTKNKIWNLVKN
jgi:hypothetical protein